MSAVTAAGNRNAGGTALPGAGVAPHAVAFVGDDLLISASGDAVAVWDLNRTTPGDFLPADIEPHCSACGPHDVAVSPNGTKAVITDPGYAFVDFEKGETRTGSTKAQIMGAVWVDDDTFLAFAPGDGAVLVVGADQQVRHQIQIARQTGLVGADLARRPDGVVVAVIGESLVSIPSTLDSAESRPVDAQFLSADGRFAIRSAGDPPRVELLSTEDLGVAGVIQLASGDELLMAGPSDGSTVPLVVADEGGSVRVDIRAVKDGALRSSRRISREGEGAFGGFKAPEARFTTGHLMAAEGTRLMRHDLGTGVRTELAAIGLDVRTMRGLGVSADGSALVVVSLADGAVLRIPLSPEVWSRDACLRAGRPGTPDDLLRAGIESQGLVLGCS